MGERIAVVGLRIADVGFRISCWDGPKFRKRESNPEYDEKVTLERELT